MKFTHLYRALPLSLAGVLVLVPIAQAGGSHGAKHGSSMTSQAPDYASGATMRQTAMGTVVSVDTTNNHLVLNHEALPAMGMEAMTMGYPVAKSINLNRYREGDYVQFSIVMIHGQGMSITEVKPAK